MFNQFLILLLFIKRDYLFPSYFLAEMSASCHIHFLSAEKCLVILPLYLLTYGTINVSTFCGLLPDSNTNVPLAFCSMAKTRGVFLIYA